MNSLALIDMFVRGIAVGAMLVTGLSVGRSGVGPRTQLIVLLASLSICFWLITESSTLWSALGHAYPLVIPAYPIAGMFWLLVLTIFEDRPFRAWMLVPAAVLLATGFLCDYLGQPTWLWSARNLFGGALSLHAVFVVARGWAGDLVEGRRRLRSVVLGFGALFGVANVALAFISRLDPSGPWMEFTAGHPLGGAIFALVILAAAVVFLQARSAVFGASRRVAPAVDGRTEAAERLMLGKLNELMAAGGWRQEGLTIGEVARRLGEPEHRLRRLINRRLGHRNFADFVNGYRIDAAKQRLADPQDARTTVAAIAFDLGYGSLGPFNRAFRAATGSTPTEWRRKALQVSPELQQAV